jgi:hypothetical protein
MTLEMGDLSEAEARRIAEEVLRIPRGFWEAVWRTPDGLQFSAPLTPTTELRGEDPERWQFLGAIWGPRPDCSDLGLDPEEPPCSGRVEWTELAPEEIDELIDIISDDIYENPELWIG